MSFHSTCIEPNNIYIFQPLTSHILLTLLHIENHVSISEVAHAVLVPPTGAGHIGEVWKLTSGYMCGPRIGVMFIPQAPPMPRE